MSEFAQRVAVFAPAYRAIVEEASVEDRFQNTASAASRVQREVIESGAITRASRSLMLTVSRVMMR